MKPFESVSGFYLTHIQKELEALRAIDPEGTSYRHLNYVRSIAEKSTIRKLLMQITNNEELLNQVASRSYRHVNHFDKIVLIGNNDVSGYRLTLHLWDPPYQEEFLNEELIHDHRFNFWSAIVTGVLTSDNYQLSETGMPMQNYRYIPEVRSANFIDFYKYCGEVFLKQVPKSVYKAGEGYSMIGPSIHQVLLPKDNMTCTLVLRGPRLREYANVYNTAYPKDNTCFDNRMFSPNELKIKISKLLEKINEL